MQSLTFHRALAAALLGLAGMLVAADYKLKDGTTVSGEGISFTDKGVVLKNNDGKALELLPPGARLVNGYGPTECTTFACCCVIDRAPPSEAALPGIMAKLEALGAGRATEGHCGRARAHALGAALDRACVATGGPGFSGDRDRTAA